jgi:Ca2+/Na+ antiporter
VSDKPPFDPIRAAFWLIAFVVGIYGVVIVAFAAACVVHATAIITSEISCDPNNRLMGLLAAALAAALAFAGIRRDGKDK